MWTRYGHKLEMRDTGWAQHGPIDSKSRDGEYSSPQHLSQETVKDYRWIKIRTKGGMLRQSYDKGFDPQDDDFIKRLLRDETEAQTEREDLHWANKDARQIRDVTRYGIKFVLDDRGTDPKHAQDNEAMRCNGALLKGRRTGGSKINKTRTGAPTGFYWEFNENDDANHTTWGSPLGLAMEMNDATEYIALTAGLGSGYAMPWQGIKENEFLRKPVRAQNPETTTHHLILDLENEYVRLKTRSNGGPGPDNPAINPAVAMDINQGFEARDGSQGDGPWVELVDGDHRGFWFSKNYKLGVWRAQSGVKMYVVQDDTNKRIVLYNGEVDGKIQIYCAGKFEIISNGMSLSSNGNDYTISCPGDLNLIAGGKIKMKGGSTLLTVGPNDISSNKLIRAPEFVVGNGGIDPAVPAINVLNPPLPVPSTWATPFEPRDRGATYNTPSIVSDAEIEHPIA